MGDSKRFRKPKKISDQEMVFLQKWPYLPPDYRWQFIRWGFWTETDEARIWFRQHWISALHEHMRLDFRRELTAEER